MPLRKTTSQITLFVLRNKVAMLNVILHAISAHIYSLARLRIISSSNRHGRENCPTSQATEGDDVKGRQKENIIVEVRDNF